MSVAHVNFDKDQKAIQITVRLFIDDLQTALNSVSTTKQIELATDREPATIDSIYNSYLKKKFKIDVNALTKEFDYLGKQYKDDMTVFYLEIPNVSEINTLRIQNNILCDSFSEQENIVKTNINNKQKSHILTKKETIVNLRYE